jgi:hypothetical protein
MLNEIPGLVYARGDKEGLAEELVDTGVQRLLGDLDSCPIRSWVTVCSSPRVAHPRSARSHWRIAWFAATARSSSLVLTYGCKFNLSLLAPFPA